MSSRKRIEPLLDQCREFELVLQEVQRAFNGGLDKNQRAALKARVELSLTKQDK